MQVFKVELRIVINTLEDVTEENVKEALEEAVADFDYGTVEVESVKEED